MPVGIAKLPLNKVGYPVPWFVWTNPDTNEPDFRVVKPGAIRAALTQNLCWICGESMIGTQAFVIGPMCAVNRTSAEPPSHLLCARWAAIACPFLARPEMVRRDHFDFEHVGMAGEAILRNPGVGLVWPTRRGEWSVFQVPNGILFQIGEPVRTPEWYAHGRVATREEAEHSIDTGLPSLHKIADEEGPDALEELDRLVGVARTFLPV